MPEFRLLGPVELVLEGEVVPLRAAKPRALLAILLLSRNRVVSLDRIVDELWSDEPPETATKAAQVYVSQLRKLLGDRLERRAPGYVLRVEEGEADADRFEALLARADEQRERGDDAAETLAEALALWRGPALGEFAEAPFAAAEAARLEELRLTAVERRVDVDLERGRYGAVVAELERLVRDQPLRERPHEQLMLALYRSGRQADALAVYRALRERLAYELGLTPSAALRDLERRILQQDPELEAARQPTRPPPTTAPPRRARRTWLAALAAAVLVAAGAIAAVVLGGGSAAPASQQQPTPTAGLRPFVAKLENFLAQSQAGRAEIGRIARLADSCKLSPRQALSRLGLVERNRQSLLEQTAALSVPDDEKAVLASDRFQKAIQASIASDWLYRRWLGGGGRCASGPAPTAGDTRATTAKQEFVAVFNPLARRYSQRTWQPFEF